MSEQLLAIQTELKDLANNMAKKLSTIENGKEAETKEFLDLKNGFKDLLDKQKAEHDKIVERVKRMEAAGALPAGGQVKTMRDVFKDGFQKHADVLDSMKRGDRGVSLRVKNIMNSTDNFTGVYQVPDRRPDVVSDPATRLHLRDVLPVTGTSSNMTEWIVETAKVGAPNYVSRELSGEDEVKPSTENDFKLESTTAKLIAHLKTLPLSWLSDYSMLVGFIQTIGITELANIEDIRLLNGTGLSFAPLGLLQVPGTTAFDPDGETVAFPDFLDTLNFAEQILGSTSINGGGFEANFIVMHPITFAKLRSSKDQDGRLQLPNMFSPDGQSVLGIPVVRHRAIAKGNVLIGDRNQCQIQDYEPLSVLFSTENRHNFESNLITMRIERSIKFPIWNPKGFMKYNIETAIAALTAGGE